MHFTLMGKLILPSLPPSSFLPLLIILCLPLSYSPSLSLIWDLSVPFCLSFLCWSPALWPHALSGQYGWSLQQQKTMFPSGIR